MALPIEELIPEEEYLDDPIQLIPQSDNLTSYREPEEFTAYKQKSCVPVTFFNIERNIKLLNNCRPLCIKLVDCNQYPGYCYKLNKEYRYQYNNLQNNDSDYSGDDDDNDDIIYTENEAESLSVEAKNILHKISSNSLTIKVKMTKTKKKIKGIDYKKNKGLIGMKITPKFEVIEIDDDSDDSKIVNVNEEKETSSDVTAEVNKKSTDMNTTEIDWTIENNTVSTVPVISETTEAAKDIAEATYSDSSHNPNIDEVEKVSLDTPNINKQSAITVKPAVNSIEDNIEKIALALKDKDADVGKDEKFNEKFVLEENTCKSLTESTATTISTINNDNAKQVSIHCSTIVTNSETVNNDEDCSKSPVFPCTPPKKIKKFTNGRHDKSKLVIHHPKDFIDNKFKPNRLSSPKATNERSPEKVTLIQDNATECIKSSDSMPLFNSKTNVQAQNQEQIMKQKPHEKNMENLNKNDDNIRTEGQQLDELKLQATSCQNKNDHEVISNVATGGKNDIRNLISNESNKDEQCISRSHTSNKEQIIKLKLDENIYKDIIEKHKTLQVNKRNETQRTSVFDAKSKVSSQTNKTNHLIKSKIDSLDQNYWKPPSISIAEQQTNSSHTIDTILAQRKPEDTSNMSEKVHIFQKIGSAVLHDNNILQEHVDKRPQFLSKSRISPFTGSISNWQSKTNELARPNNNSRIGTRVSKNLNFETAYLNHVRRVMGQDIVSSPAQKPQVAGTAFHNNMTNESDTYQIAQTDYNKHTARNNSVIIGRNGFHNLQNSAVSRNNRSESVIYNGDHIAEQNRANVSQNSISRHQRSSYFIPSFGPQPRHIVRPIMRQDGTQVLSVTHYPKHMYSNTVNSNSVPINPYVGYNSNYNSYWPYQYTNMPPPPPPPPPPPTSRTVIPNILQTHGKVNAPENNKANVITQINKIPRPVPEHFQNNNVPDRRNLIDINLKSTPPKIANNSQNVVSSKTEMFEELEKEMMNIHHEDSENFINNQLCDNRPVDKHNKVKSDPRIKASLNAADITAPQLKKTAPIQSTNRASKIFMKVPREDHDNTKDSKYTTLPLKRPSNELILKDTVKKKKNIVSTPKLSKLDKNNAAVSDTSALVYSPPVLPIPTFKQTLDILTRASNDALKRLEAFDKSRKQFSVKGDNANGNPHLKKDKVKKISLDEYKKRGDKGACDRKKRKYERKKKDETEKKCVEAKHPNHNTDQDQGYDSDSTIVL